MIPLGTDPAESVVPIERTSAQLLGRDLLEEHGEVSEPEGLAESCIVSEQGDPLIDASEASIAAVEVTGGDGCKVRVEIARLGASSFDPSSVFCCEVVQRLPGGTLAGV